MPIHIVIIPLSPMSQVRLGRNDTKPPAPGLEDLFYRYGMLPSLCAANECLISQICTLRLMS